MQLLWRTVQYMDIGYGYRVGSCWVENSTFFGLVMAETENFKPNFLLLFLLLLILDTTEIAINCQANVE